MKSLLFFAIASVAIGGTSFNPAPQKSKEQVTTISSSQAHDFSFFRLHRQGKGNVVLNWGVTTIEGVTSFAVERSYDGDFYDVINQQGCNGQAKHTFKDENVFPGYIYYRVNCLMNDGSVHSTPVEAIRIVQH